MRIFIEIYFWNVDGYLNLSQFRILKIQIIFHFGSYSIYLHLACIHEQILSQTLCKCKHIFKSYLGVKKSQPFSRSYYGHFYPFLPEASEKPEICLSTALSKLCKKPSVQISYFQFFQFRIYMNKNFLF